MSVSAQNLVSTALNAGNLAVGNAVPAGAEAGHVFADQFAAPLGGGGLWNIYASAGPTLYWGSGIGGALTLTNEGWSFQLAPAGSAGQPVVGLTQLAQLTVAGNLRLFFGTLTVARDPASAMDVATMGWVGANTVASFNARKGPVTLESADIYQALCLDSPIASQNYVQQAITNAIQNLLWTCNFVTQWNGRTGSVYLTLSDITCVFFQPGQQPVSPTPALTSNDNSIATTQWVTEYLANEFAGSGGNLATQSWVLANTVNSFNGRMGNVTLTQADVFDVGAAPLNSPNFSGIPTAPTQQTGNVSGAIATTAYVWSVMEATTGGVTSFNGRAGIVTLTAADITGAGGLTNPSPTLTGQPVAPTQAPGTNLPVIATCEFVQQALTAGAVTSFNTRTGAVTLQLIDITGVGGAPLVSPNFSSVPTAPTAAPGTNTVQLATCAFVTAALTAAGGVSSFNGRTGAVDLIANDISGAGGLVNPSVNLTGTPTAPTATTGTNTQQIATTAFVTASLGSTVTSFNTRTGAVVLTGADITQAGGAVLASPAFTGTPTGPTAVTGTNNTQLATTQFVNAEIAGSTNLVQSFNGRTGSVTLQLADVTGVGGAPVNNANLTGTPTGPTATAGTSTTQLATTAFVQAAIAGAGVASFNGRTGAVTLVTNDVSAAGGALIASPTFTGVPAAPTATAGTNTTQIATTAYVMAATAQPGTAAPLMNGTAAVGTSLLYARQDHVHPTDTSRAAQASLANYLPLAGGNLTGALGINGGGSVSSNDLTLTNGMSLNGQGIVYTSTLLPQPPVPIGFNLDSVTSALISGLAFTQGGAAYNAATAGWAVRSRSQAGSQLPVLMMVTNTAYTSLTLYGNASNTGTIAITASDRRLKSNIQPTGTDALGIINRLPVYDCDMRPVVPDEPGEHWDCALIADEVRDLIPRAYMAAPEHGYENINQLPVVATLVRAVQQLTERVHALEAR